MHAAFGSAAPAEAAHPEMDVDLADMDTPEAVAEYVGDIMSFFKDTEVSTRARARAGAGWTDDARSRRTGAPPDRNGTPAARVRGGPRPTHSHPALPRPAAAPTPCSTSTSRARSRPSGSGSTSPTHLTPAIPANPKISPFPPPPPLFLPVRAQIAKTAKFGYMAHQTDINEKMRAILVDWLVEVHNKFKLMPETMYLTVNLIDRFLERKMVVRQKLQLVGVTAMLIASKYEEIYAPEVRDFVYITDKAYTKEQILMMEAMMLNTLDFRVTVPTPYVFLSRYLKVAGENDPTAKVSLLATYLVERSLQEYKMLHFAPSKIAAAGVNMALRTLRGPGAWGAKMERYSRFSQADLADTIRDVQSSLEGQAANNLKAVHKKYSQPKFGEVALIPVANL
jgi:hypothetical protein